jgi:nickel transport protein
MHKHFSAFGMSPVRGVLIFFLLILFSISAYAHKVNMFGYVEGNKVIMEGYFSDGNKPMNCAVVVSDSKGMVLVKGVTDKEGKFSFDVPAITDLHVVLDAGMGHRAEYVISKNELAGVSPADHQAVGSDSSNKVDAPAIAENSENTDASSSSISEAMVRKAVTDATIPLLRSMDELKQSANFSNIVGGIGFIVGLVGALFYVKARKLLARLPTQTLEGKVAPTSNS